MRPPDPRTAELSIQSFDNGAEVLLLKHSDGTERVLARKWATDATVWELMKKGLEASANEPKLAGPHSCLHQRMRSTQDWADRNNLGEILTGVVDGIGEAVQHGEFTHRLRLDAPQRPNPIWATRWIWMKPQDLQHLPSAPGPDVDLLTKHGFSVVIDPNMPQDVIRIGDTEIKISPPEDDGEPS